MAVLNDIRALFAQCPALKDLEARTDQLETDAEGYGIFPAGSAIIEQDMRGAATWQYNFIIAAARMTADDIMRLDNGVPNAATCRSLEMGVIRCQDEILEQVRRDTGLSITEVQVERVLNGKSCSISEEAKNIILTYGRQYVKRIVSAIMEAGFDLQAVPAVFLGGGARLFERNVSPQDRLCRLITLPDVCLNAAGFERLAGQILKR